MLPIRLRPFKLESLPSYLCRLANVNGWPFMSGFLTVTGIKQSNVDPHYNINKLAELTLIPVNDLHLLELPEIDKKSSLFISGSPRFCPQCIITEPEPYCHKDQQSLTNIYCEKHQCELINHCPACGTLLDWHESVFSHCHQCEQKWSEMKHVTSFNPHYQQWISSGDVTQKMILLHRAITRLIYPSDLVPIPFPPKFKVHNRYIQEAFNLLQGRYNNLWTQYCKNDRQYLAVFDECYVTSPLTELMAAECLPPASTKLIATWPTFTVADRIDKHPHITVPAVDRITTAMIRKMLGLTMAQLDAFEDSGHFKSLYHVSNRQHKMYDMRQICAWFSTRMSTDQVNYSRPISYNKMLMLNGIEPQMIIKGINEGKFRIAIRLHQQQLTLMIAEDDVKAYIKQHQIIEPTDDMSQKWVSQRLKIQQKGLRPLVQAQLLTFTRTRDITQASLSRFLQQYSTVLHFCHLHKFKRSKVEKLIKECELVPIFSNSLCTILTLEQLAQLQQKMGNDPKYKRVNNEKWVC
ncbi:TniQ family protein [Shewanella vesiculosa]|uniref:TniQ family protein n=1 Tax=Shewanella vesiculosa TaxID=518738 RepID=UPI00384FF432